MFNSFHIESFQKYRKLRKRKFSCIKLNTKKYNFLQISSRQPLTAILVIQEFQHLYFQSHQNAHFSHQQVQEMFRFVTPFFFRESRTTYITEAVNNLINRKLDHLMNHLLELKDSVSQKQTTAKLVCNDETPKIFSYTASGLLSVLKYPSKNESNSNEQDYQRG